MWFLETQTKIKFGKPPGILSSVVISDKIIGCPAKSEKWHCLDMLGCGSYYLFVIGPFPERLPSPTFSWGAARHLSFSGPRYHFSSPGSLPSSSLSDQVFILCAGRDTSLRQIVYPGVNFCCVACLPHCTVVSSRAGPGPLPAGSLLPDCRARHIVGSE